MAIINFDYSCGGTSTNKKKIVCKVDDRTGILTDLAIYEGPCNPVSGEFVPHLLKKSTVKNEGDISDHVAGIKLKLKEELNINNPTFKF